MEHRRILVVGLGRFGTSIVEALWEAGAHVTALDVNEETVEHVKAHTGSAYVGDGTEDDVLEGIGAAEVDSAIVTFGEQFEASVLCVAALRKLGVEHVVARATTARKAEILKSVGATRVVELELDMGHRLANELVTPVTDELIEFAAGYRVVPWSAQGPLVGKTLRDAQLREDYEINVIGYRRRSDRLSPGAKPRLRVPGPDYVVREGDTLMLVGEEDAVNRFVEEVGG